MVDDFGEFGVRDGLAVEGLDHGRILQSGNFSHDTPVNGIVNYNPQHGL